MMKYPYSIFNTIKYLFPKVFLFKVQKETQKFYVK